MDMCLLGLFAQVFVSLGGGSAGNKKFLFARKCLPDHMTLRI